MSEQVLEIVIQQAMQSGSPQISFGWQGGEPTLMGLPFYKKAVEFQREYGSPGQVVGNGLQTNGLLIDEDWCQFLRETNWLVGLSIDGPAHVHDHYRVTRNRRPTYEQVCAAAQRMHALNVEYNALVVVNDYSVRYAREIYQHHKDLGIRFMQFIPCVERDPLQPDRAAPFSVTAEDYGVFLCEIFDCWKEDFRGGKPTVSVRYFDSVFHTYVSVPPPECTLLPECGNYLVIEHNGDIFSCDFFVEEAWKLGNVTDGTLLEMLNSPKQRQFGLLKADMPPECLQCEWKRHCYGGCPKDRIRDPADQGSNHFCRSFIRFFEHADRDLRNLAEDWLRRQRLYAQQERFNHLIASQQASRSPVSQASKQPARNSFCPCGSGKKFKNCCGS